MVFRVFKYLVNFFFTFKLFARRILFIISLLGTYQLKSDKLMLKFVILDITKKKSKIEFLEKKNFWGVCPGLNCEKMDTKTGVEKQYYCCT